MAVQLTFDKSREIFRTLGTLKQGGLKLRFQITEREIIVETEYTSTRSTRAVVESVSLANSYIRDLAQFRALVTMKIHECVRAQLGQPAERRLEARIVADLTQEINSAIEGLRKLKDDQYKTEAEKSSVIDRIIREDFQPLLDQINPPGAAMSSSGSASSPSSQRLPRENSAITSADLPAEVLRLKTEVGQLREEIDRLKKQAPSSSKKDTFLVILIALNVIVIGIQVFNFIQEG